MPTPPTPYQRFMDDYADVGEAYEALGKAATQGGPLDGRTAHLIKLGLAAGMQHEGAVHAHARKALGAGVTPDELRHAAVLAVTTLGFPRMMATLTWVEDMIEEHASDE